MACRIERQPDLLFVISTSTWGREFAFPKGTAEQAPSILDGSWKVPEVQEAS